MPPAAIATQGQRRFYSEAEYSMRMLAQETGAQAYFPLQIFELKGIYASIAQELSSQYSLAYSPNNAQADGRFRRRFSCRVASASRAEAADADRLHRRSAARR